MKISHKHRHHIAVTIAVGLAAFAHALLPEHWSYLAPWAGFGASLIWIWSD